MVKMISENTYWEWIVDKMWWNSFFHYIKYEPLLIRQDDTNMIPCFLSHHIEKNALSKQKERAMSKSCSSLGSSKQKQHSKFLNFKKLAEQKKEGKPKKINWNH